MIDPLQDTINDSLAGIVLLISILVLYQLGAYLKREWRKYKKDDDGDTS